MGLFLHFLIVLFDKNNAWVLLNEIAYSEIVFTVIVYDRLHIQDCCQQFFDSLNFVLIKFCLPELSRHLLDGHLFCDFEFFTYLFQTSHNLTLASAVTFAFFRLKVNNHVLVNLIKILSEYCGRNIRVNLMLVTAHIAHHCIYI